MALCSGSGQARRRSERRGTTAARRRRRRRRPRFAGGRAEGAPEAGPRPAPRQDRAAAKALAAGAPSCSWPSRRDILVLWVAIHRVPGLGPFLAKTVGPSSGGRHRQARGLAYDLDDRWQRFWRTDEAPKATGKCPRARLLRGLRRRRRGGQRRRPTAGWCPRRRGLEAGRRGADARQLVGAGRRAMITIADVRPPRTRRAMYKTLLHPDRKPQLGGGVRGGGGAVARAAAPRRRAIRAGEQGTGRQGLPATGGRPHRAPPTSWPPSTAGSRPRTATTDAHRRRDPGQARKDSCTLVHYQDTPSHPRTWPHVARGGAHAWWRQTPHCMMEQGKLHPGLTVDGNTKWGATLEGAPSFAARRSVSTRPARCSSSHRRLDTAPPSPRP